MSLAVAGGAPDWPIHDRNAVELVLGEPFHEHSPWIKGVRCNPGGHFMKERLQPHKPAFVDGITGAQISHGRLRRDVYKLANGFRNVLKLQPAAYTPGGLRDPIISPVVLIHLPNSIVYPVIKLAVWAAGLTATTVNFAYTPSELAHTIQASRPAAIFTQPGSAGYDVVKAALASLDDDTLRAPVYQGKIFTVDTEREDYGATLHNPSATGQASGTRDWKRLLVGQPDDFQVARFSHSDESARRCATIIWSSGTSGKSKGVVLSHRYFSFGTQTVWYGNPWFDNNEVFIGVPPFFHIFGLSNVMLTGVAIGATVICLPKFDPVRYLTLIQAHRASHLHIAPPVGVLLAKSPLVDQFDLSSVKAAISGGAPLGVSIIEEVYRRLGFPVRMSYGSSEAASVSQTKGNTWQEISRALSATGAPYPGVEVKVIATDGSGQILKRGERGELLLRSPSLFNCYLHNTSATAEALDGDDWIHTGDVGVIDELDNVYIVDRLKEVIKVKGFQVAPAELEDALNGHAEVADAGVTSTYSEDEATELPMAFIVPKDGTLLSEAAKGSTPSPRMIDLVKRINSHIEKQLINYKWLRGGVVVCEAIPKSNSGKLLRREFKNVKGYFVQLYSPSTRAVRTAKL